MLCCAVLSRILDTECTAGAADCIVGPRISIVFAWWDAILRPKPPSAEHGPACQPPWTSGASVDTIQPVRNSVGLKEVLVVAAAERDGRQTESIQKSPEWVADMLRGPDMDDLCTKLSGNVAAEVSQSGMQQCACICPVWQALNADHEVSHSAKVRQDTLINESEQSAKRVKNGSSAGKRSTLEMSQLPPLRFFLRSDREIFDTYNPS